MILLSKQSRVFPNFVAGLIALAGLAGGCQTQPQSFDPGVSLESEPQIVPSPAPTQLPIEQFPRGSDATARHGIARSYLSRLEGLGVEANRQGLWVQSEKEILATNQETALLPAASVTKVATTLAALKQLGPNFRFETEIGVLGEFKQGVLNGDLVIQGSDDPFFVWEDAIAIANLLEDLGIQKITGNLLVQGPFGMNFDTDSFNSGELLRTALNQELWSQEVAIQFDKMPPGTRRPKIEVQGQVKVIEHTPQSAQWVLRHSSLPLIELLKRMNRYSNNPMADQIATFLGGAAEVTRIVREMTGLPDAEVLFINGSGLGEENRISTRGSVYMMVSLAQLLASHQLSLGDALTVIGQDEGILDTRNLPILTVIKSGTLNSVSALVGAIPSRTEGIIWFSMLNNDGNVEKFRQVQEQTLQEMIDTWGILEVSPKLLAPSLKPESLNPINEILS